MSTLIGGYELHERRRNYALLVAEGILFTIGLVFFDPTTVVPLLMERLTGSAVLVGLVGAIQPLAKGVAPVISGNWISALPRKKTFLVTAMAVGRLPMWALGLCLLLVPAAPGWVWAVVLLMVQLLFWVGDSTGDPAWMDLIGKSVADDRRGRFFATRQVAGGLLSIAAGALVATILAIDGLPFPRNYGVVVLIGALIFVANIGTFVGLIERPSATSTRHRVVDLIRQLPGYLTSNRSFARMMLVLLLFNAARMSGPFFIVFGRQMLGLSDSALGVVIPAQMIGRIAGAVLWGSLGDRRGHERAIRGVNLVALLPPAIALLIALTGIAGAPVVAFAVLFAVLGVSLEGWPPYINYMLAAVSEDERPRYAGLMGIGYVPAGLAPIAGGLVVQYFGFVALFGISIGITAVAALLSFSLPGARKHSR